DDPADLGPLRQTALEFAVDVDEEDDVAGAEGGGGRPLLRLAEGHELRPVGVRIPRTLRAVGQDELGDGAAGGGPLGQRGAAAEVDVVGVGADGQGPGGHGQVDGGVTSAGRVEIAG